MDLVMVVRKSIAPASATESEPEYLTCDLTWGKADEAYTYCSFIAFTEAIDNGGEVYLRFANGYEVPVAYHLMFSQPIGVEVQ